nr:MAG TPA: hypothetical protein [Caudoviricetes sp.]
MTRFRTANYDDTTANYSELRRATTLQRATTKLSIFRRCSERG